MPCSLRYRPAGLSGLIEPAGLMWSVVTESPSSASTRAPSTSVTGAGSRPMPSKYGGFRADVRVDPPLEVPVAREHRDDGQVVLLHRGGDLLGKGTRVADARRAAEADHV